VVFGNLLENAIEACERIEDGEKKIRMRSNVHYEKLIIAMDNTTTPDTRTQGGVFMSSKRSGPGTGLQSVASIAESTGGSARFEREGEIFHSSVYLHI